MITGDKITEIFCATDSSCLPFVLTEKGAQEVGNDVYSILCVLRQGLCRAGYMHLPIDSGFQ